MSARLVLAKPECMDGSDFWLRLFMLVNHLY